MRYITKCAK